MEDNRLIHTYTEPTIARFRYAFYLLIMAIGFLVGTAFFIGPVILFIVYQSMWSLLFSVFIPLGLWMNRRILRLFKKMRWQNSHISSYRLYQNTIETTEWPSAWCIERKIPLKSITTVVASPYIVSQTITEYGADRVITETAPILCIMYIDNGESHLLNIPFSHHDDPAINVWLCHLKEQLVPIDFTARFLFRKDSESMTDRQRMEMIETSNELMPLSFSGDWQTDYPFAWDTWTEKMQKRQWKEKTVNPELVEAHLKRSKKDWFFTLLIVFKVMIVAAILRFELGERLPIPPTSILPGLVIFLMGAFLFFYLLKRRLRWFYMISFSLIVFLIACLSCMAADTEGAAAESLGLAGALFPAIVWIPYLTVKRVTAKKVDPDMKEVGI